MCKLKVPAETEKQSLWLPWPSFGWELPGFVVDVPIAAVVFFPNWKQYLLCTAAQGCHGTSVCRTGG